MTLRLFTILLHCLTLSTFDTAISRKVVGKKRKSARDNPGMYCGYF